MTKRLNLIHVAVACAFLGTGAAATTAAAQTASKIAFISSRDGNNDIYVMDADGSNSTNLTNQASLDVDPAWSPDGTQIAFRSTRDGNAEIYVMNAADGSNPTNLTNHASNDFAPAWSPDATQIAFRSLRDGNAEIYVMNATDGSNPTNLTMNNPSFDQQPAWSPAPAEPVPAISLEGKVTLVLLMLGLTWFTLIAERQQRSHLGHDG